MDFKKIDVNGSKINKVPISQAVVFEKLIFVSGQVAKDLFTGEIISSSISEETEKIIENINLILLECGSSIKNIIKMSIFLKDMKDYDEVNKIYTKYFSKISPSRYCIGGIKLALGFNVEIDVIAYINNKK
jgi:2-iminobutanoate/2-iminopropanoate deaminase